MEEKKLTISQAVDILVQSVELARTRGAYTFPEAALINSALIALQNNASNKGDSPSHP